MKQFIVVEGFKGSTTGANCIDFTVDQRVTDEQLGEDLTAVALEGKWIKKAPAAKALDPKK